jgi:restriction endonuclease
MNLFIFARNPTTHKTCPIRNFNTQDIVQNKDSLLRIENKKAIVNTITNGIIIRKELGVGKKYNNKQIRKINAKNIVLSDGSMEDVDYHLSDDALRTMIKETIQIRISKTKFSPTTPRQALKEVTTIVRTNLIGMIKTKIHYAGMDGTISPNVFLNENNETYLKAGAVGKYQKDIDREFALKEKWIFRDVIEYDSDFEVEIVEQDPDMREIEIFGKLPKLKIKTPLGEYNPDFCYAIKAATGNKLFLVVESKGYETSANIPPDEKAKIEFAKKYFERLNEYYSAQNANVRISFKERINNTQLASLIKQLEIK